MFNLIPIGDDNRDRRHAPLVTYALIAANIAIFFRLQWGHPMFTQGYALVPWEIMHGVDLAHTVNGIPQAPGPHPIYWTLLSAMFMHGSVLHLGGNMLYLWIFGDNMEDAMGHGRFLVFYMVCGLAAAAVQIIANPQSVVPMLGASGAIAGVLGGYLLMFPRRRVRVLIGCLGIINLSAFVVIGLWILLQLINGVGQLAAIAQDSGGVAYLAHIGGVTAGLLLAPLFRQKRQVGKSTFRR